MHNLYIFMGSSIASTDHFGHDYFNQIWQIRYCPQGHGRGIGWRRERVCIQAEFPRRLLIDPGVNDLIKPPG